MVRLPAHVARPGGRVAGARCADRRPGPWSSIGRRRSSSWSAELVGGAWLWVRFGSSAVGTQRRRRLGVEVGARLATRRDLAPLIVTGPMRGRFILGTVDRRSGGHRKPPRPNPPSTRWRGAGDGDRSAVAVIGPTRSGKTATVIAGILDWDGPAILSSVQNDLFDATVQPAAAARRRVRVRSAAHHPRPAAARACGVAGGRRCIRRGRCPGRWKRRTC